MLGEILITLFALIAIMVAGGVFAVLYLLMYTLGSAFRGIFRIVRPSNFAPPGAHVCPRGLCRAENPPQARFCRRCGHELNHASVVGQRVFTG
jgi:hypothetical protein